MISLLNTGLINQLVTGARPVVSFFTFEMQTPCKDLKRLQLCTIRKTFWHPLALALSVTISCLIFSVFLLSTCILENHGTPIITARQTYTVHQRYSEVILVRISTCLPQKGDVPADLETHEK